MAWTLSGKTIRPGDKGDVHELTSSYAIQRVLDATANTISYFGSDSLKRTLNFILFENDNAGAGLSGLKTAVQTNADVALVSDQGAQGNVRILKLTAARRMDHANTLPVYECTAELIAV